MRLLALGMASAAIVFCVGCGSTTPDTSDSGTTPDAGLSEAGDDGAVDAAVAYPADHTPLPLVDYNGGRILQNPKIVTVTFSGDPLESRLQQFGDVITTTNWWTTVSSEYCQQPNNQPCIGPGSSGGHVVISDPAAASYVDSSQGGTSTIQDFIRQHVVGDADAGVTADFPAPDDNTLYVLYFPDSTTITLDGSDSCSSFGAYHNTTILPNKNNVPQFVAYAIIPRCDTKEAVTTVSASHEIIEAATDPDIGENSLSYYMLNQLWAVAGGEVGDLCEGFGSSGTTTTESTFVVQRSWSNKSAAAGHDPCVPIPEGEVYFNAAPRQAKVVLPKQGATATLDIDAFSDGPKDAWTISAIDFASFQQGLPDLSFSFDNTTVKNGDHVVLTITAKVALPGGSDEFAIVSKDANGQRHSWPVQATTH